MWTQSTALTCTPPGTSPHLYQPCIPKDDGVFSGAWNALRFPGSHQRVPKARKPMRGLYPATAALCHALLSPGRTIWIDQPEGSLLHQWGLWLTRGHIASTPETADFTLVTCPSQLPALYHLNVGDGRDPATATTLLLQVPTLGRDGDVLWSSKKACVTPQNLIPGLPRKFWRQRMELQDMLPWGIDIFFIHDHSFVALPRSVTVTATCPA